MLVTVLYWDYDLALRLYEPRMWTFFGSLLAAVNWILFPSWRLGISTGGIARADAGKWLVVGSWARQKVPKPIRVIVFLQPLPPGSAGRRVRWSS